MEVSDFIIEKTCKWLGNRISIPKPDDVKIDEVNGPVLDEAYFRWLDERQEIAEEICSDYKEYILESLKENGYGSNR